MSKEKIGDLKASLLVVFIFAVAFAVACLTTYSY